MKLTAGFLLQLGYSGPVQTAPRFRPSPKEGSKEPAWIGIKESVSVQVGALKQRGHWGQKQQVHLRGRNRLGRPRAGGCPQGDHCFRHLLGGGWGQTFGLIQELNQRI